MFKQHLNNYFHLFDTHLNGFITISHVFHQPQNLKFLEYYNKYLWSGLLRQQKGSFCKLHYDLKCSSK